MKLARSSILALSVAGALATLATEALADTTSADGTYQSLTVRTASSDFNHTGLLIHNATQFHWGGTVCNTYTSLTSSQIELLGNAVTAKAKGQINYKMQGAYRCITGFSIYMP